MWWYLFLLEYNSDRNCISKVTCYLPQFYLISECGDNSMSLEQMNRLGLLQQDPLPVQQNLNIRIPSPSNSNASTGYPSPTPSLPGLQATQQLLQLQNGIAVLMPQQRMDNSHINTAQLYTTMPPQVYQHKQSLANHQANLVTVTRRENACKPQSMWRPW